jgi:hypothetical protein
MRALLSQESNKTIQSISRTTKLKSQQVEITVSQTSQASHFTTLNKAKGFVVGLRTGKYIREVWQEQLPYSNASSEANLEIGQLIDLIIYECSLRNLSFLN